MSELKVYHCNEYTEFVMKSEADKALAEKDAEIAKLKAQVEEERSAKAEAAKLRSCLKCDNKPIKVFTSTEASKIAEND